MVEADWMVEEDRLDEADIIEDDEPLKVVRRCVRRCVELKSD